MHIIQSYTLKKMSSNNFAADTGYEILDNHPRYTTLMSSSMDVNSVFSPQQYGRAVCLCTINHNQNYYHQVGEAGMSVGGKPPPPFTGGI